MIAAVSAGRSLLSLEGHQGRVLVGVRMMVVASFEINGTTIVRDHRLVAAVERTMSYHRSRRIASRRIQF